MNLISSRETCFFLDDGEKLKILAYSDTQTIHPQSCVLLWCGEKLCETDGCLECQIFDEQVCSNPTEMHYVNSGWNIMKEHMTWKKEKYLKNENQGNLLIERDQNRLNPAHIFYCLAAENVEPLRWPWNFPSLLSERDQARTTFFPYSVNRICWIRLNVHKKIE